MAVDFVVHYPCRPKHQLGEGDLLVGTEQILDCLKARGRAAAIAEIAERDGESPQGKSVTLRLMHAADGQATDRKVSYEELLNESQRLAPLESECDSCPARLLEKRFGCFGAINYPIRQAGEQWLMNRLEPSSTVGGTLLLSAIRDFGYTGEIIQQFRAANLFEADRAIRKSLKRGWFSSDQVTSDQVFQAIFCVGEQLEPGHCLGILLWLGCIRVDGAVVQSPEQAMTVNRFASPTERQARTRLDVGEPASEEAVSAMQLLLRALHASWLLDVPLLMSA